VRLILRLGPGRELAGVVLLFTVLGLLYTYPLVRYFSTGIPYVRFPAYGAEVKRMEPGDGLQLYYWFWLMKDNLAGGSPLFTNPYEFDVTPVLPPQRYGFYQFPFSLLFVLFAPFGDVVAYNSLVILSFPLAGLAMYLLVRLYTAHRGAALVAALVFALAPFRLGQLLGGHSNGFLFFLFPLTLYCWEQGLRRRGVTFGVLAGLCLLTLALTDFHLLYYLLLLAAGYWTARGIEALGLPWRDGLRTLTDAPWSGRLAALPLLAVATVGVVAAVVVARRGLGPAVALLAAAAGIAFVLGLFAFSAVLHLSGGARDPADALRRSGLTLLPLFLLSLYALHGIAEIPRLGQALTALALVGVAAGQLPALVDVARARRAELGRLVPVLGPVALAGLAAVGYVLFLKASVMGGALTVTGGRPYALIARNAPRLGDLVAPRNLDDERAIYLGLVAGGLGLWGLLRGAARAGAARVVYGAAFLLATLLSLGPSLDPYLPLYRLLYGYLPYFNYPRSPARLMVVTFVAVAVLVGYALRALPTGKTWGKAALGAVALGVALEYAPFRAVGVSLLDPANPLYRTVAAEVGDGRFLAIPLFPGDSHQSSVYEFYVTVTRARMVNGYNPLVSRSYVEGIFDRLVTLNLGEIREREHELLRALRVRFMLVHEDLFFWKVSPFPGALTTRNLEGSPFLRLRGRAGDLALFEVRATPEGSPPRFDRSSPIGSLHEVEELARRTGREVGDPEASNGRAVLADAGRDGAGYVALGVLPAYPTGAYVAAFRLQAEGGGAAEPAAVIDVSTERGRRILGRRELTAADFAPRGGYQEFDLSWAIETPSRVEFRVFYPGRGALRADRVWVAFRDRLAPAPAYEAEELLRQTGVVRADPTASGGLAVYSAPRQIPAYPAFGPYRRYPPGRYEARFRLKRDPGEAGAAELASLEVSADRGRALLAARVLSGTALAAGRYEEIALEFTVDRPAVLEFRVEHRAGAGLWVDRVAVGPAGGQR